MLHLVKLSYQMCRTNAFVIQTSAFVQLKNCLYIKADAYFDNILQINQENRTILYNMKLGLNVSN